jgi:hypothetical protein
VDVRLTLDSRFMVSVPTRGVMDFYGHQKTSSTPSFGGEVKQMVPCHIFMACKRTLRV